MMQESLDSIMAGRTTVIIAHRLSTVVNADIIAGRVGVTLLYGHLLYGDERAHPSSSVQLFDLGK